MENTGRIRKGITASARRIFFDHPFDAQAVDELWHMSRVDQAHLLMLMECDIVPSHHGTQLLAAIANLQQQQFAPLQTKTSSRGAFLRYEDYLMEQEGEEVGGMLQTARSRNDLNATVLKRRLRRPLLRLLEQTGKLHAILLKRAACYAEAVMPAYTHGQGAMPVTYGHYLAGVSQALLRALDAIFAVTNHLRQCPLGAGAVAGTSWPIRTDRTAKLLGFDAGPLNSIDAVASRDAMLHLLAACSIYGVTLSRLATDLLQWSTAEFGFLELPDQVTGSSSSMPQKKNPFLLEHIQGRGAALVGAFVHAMGSTHATPFTNSIAAGDEGMRPVWTCLDDLTSIVVLTRLMVANARPDCAAMHSRARKGFIVATAFADCLVREAGLSFRTAHRLVGTVVSQALEAAGPDNADPVSAAISKLQEHGVSVPNDVTDPASVVRKLEFGGGPGPDSLKRCLDHLRSGWREHCTRTRSLRQGWRSAEDGLDTAIAQASLLSASSLL
jgi:argininosuccinate lyase